MDGNILVRTNSGLNNITFYNIFLEVLPFYFCIEQGSSIACYIGSIPNQPHLLNKYQLNVGFSHFHQFRILSGMYVLAPYLKDIMKGSGFCNGNIILIWYWVFLPTYHDFVRWKQHLFHILFFTHLCQGIDNCFYAFGNTRNTSKFEPFHIPSQPTQIK